MRKVKTGAGKRTRISILMMLKIGVRMIMSERTGLSRGDRLRLK